MFVSKFTDKFLTSFRFKNGKKLWDRSSVIRKYCAKPSTEKNKGSDKKALLLGVYEGAENELILTAAAKKYDEKNEGKLVKLLQQCDTRITNGRAQVFTNVDPDYWAIAVAGLGPKKKGINKLEAICESREAVRVAAGFGVKSLKKLGIGLIQVESMGHAEQAAEGGTLAAWSFQENKIKTKKKTIPTLELYGDEGADAWQRGIIKADAQNLVRRLSDCPGNRMTPTIFAREVVNALCPCGLKVDVHDKDWCDAKKMQSFLAVAKGSCEPPLFIEINYCGGPHDQRPILLIGKGITYDCGGLCLKDCGEMVEYRADMAGGAVVVAAMKAAATMSLPINITGLIPCCENLISGMAMKPGDVVKGLNGKFVEIEDTDNEGRVSLIDAFVYGQDTYKPKLIVDIATLTPGVKSCLGSAAAGVFSNSETMWKEMRRASILSGDRVWRLPLWKFFMKKVTGYRGCDVNNKGRGKGDPCLGAAFLNEFVTCVDWIHMDTQGVGMIYEDKIYPYFTKRRMTGRPLRTLVQFLYQLACPQNEKCEMDK